MDCNDLWNPHAKREFFFFILKSGFQSMLFSVIPFSATFILGKDQASTNI